MTDHTAENIRKPVHQALGVISFIHPLDLDSLATAKRNLSESGYSRSVPLKLAEPHLLSDTLWISDDEQWLARLGIGGVTVYAQHSDSFQSLHDRLRGIVDAIEPVLNDDALFRLGLRYTVTLPAGKEPRHWLHPDAVNPIHSRILGSRGVVVLEVEDDGTHYHFSHGMPVRVAPGTYVFDAEALREGVKLWEAREILPRLHRESTSFLTASMSEQATAYISAQVVAEKGTPTASTLALEWPLFGKNDFRQSIDLHTSTLAAVLVDPLEERSRLLHQQFTVGLTPWQTERLHTVTAEVDRLFPQVTDREIAALDRMTSRLDAIEEETARIRDKYSLA